MTTSYRQNTHSAQTSTPGYTLLRSGVCVCDLPSTLGAAALGAAFYTHHIRGNHTISTPDFTTYELVGQPMSPMRFSLSPS